MAGLITDSKLADLLLSEFNQCYYIPNPGNAGDSLIAAGTLKFFDSINLQWKFGSIGSSYTESDRVIYAGGGNLVGVYHDCENFIKRNIRSKILLLPHTVNSVDSLLREMTSNIHIICREPRSYKYVKSAGVKNVYLHEDMAFKLRHIINSKIDKFDQMKIYGRGDFFRLDAERVGDIPDGNVDISGKYQTPTCTTLDCYHITERLLTHISRYDKIHTNRLHVAIGASMLGRETWLYANSYWKNREIHSYSLKDKVTFIA